MGARAIRSPLFHIWGQFIMWRCPTCQTDCWSHWEKHSLPEKKYEKVERIFANPLCVGCTHKIKEVTQDVPTRI